MVRLGNLARLDARQVSAGSIDYSQPYVGLENIRSEGALDESNLVEPGSIKSAKVKFDDRHILYGKLRPNLGKVARPTRAGVASTDIYPLLPGEGVDRGYLSWFLLRPETISWAAARTSGANLPRISWQVLSDLDVQLPSLPEQRRIAAILDQADSLRAKYDQAAAALSRLAEQRIVELCRDHAGSRVVPLESVAVVQGGLTVNRKREVLPQRAPYLRVANVSRRRIDLAEVKTLGVTIPEVARVAVECGDILLVEGHGNADEVGRAAMWRGISGEFVHQNHLIRARFGDEVRPVFAEYFLNSAATRRYFRGVVKTTSGLNTLNMANVRSVPILLVPMRAQLEFERFLDVLERQRQCLAQNAGLLASLFASLQHRAFGGEL